MGDLLDRRRGVPPLLLSLFPSPTVNSNFVGVTALCGLLFCLAQNHHMFASTRPLGKLSDPISLRGNRIAALTTEDAAGTPITTEYNTGTTLNEAGSPITSIPEYIECIAKCYEKVLRMPKDG